MPRSRECFWRIFQCPPIASMALPITESASACAYRITSTSLEQKPVVDWFEIISENFMVDGGRPLEVLDQILEQYRVVQHGVSMYFGSAEPLNREHLQALKALVKRTKTPWLSDHLCWGSVDGTLYARPAADALHLRGRGSRRARSARCATIWKFPSPWKTSAATRNSTSQK